MSNINFVDNPRYASQYCDVEAFKKCAKNVGGDVEELVRILEKTDRLTCQYFLPWEEKFHQGGTGYIDGVRPDSVLHSVQWGIDPWKRVFVTVHFTENTSPQVQTAAVFQRHTSGNLLVSGGHYNRSPFFSAHPFDRSDMQKLNTLLSKETVEYDDYFRGGKITLTLTTTVFGSPK